MPVENAVFAEKRKTCTPSNPLAGNGKPAAGIAFDQIWRTFIQLRSGDAPARFEPSVEKTLFTPGAPVYTGNQEDGL
jgi:hypothetical protein